MLQNCLQSWKKDVFSSANSAILVPENWYLSFVLFGLCQINLPRMPNDRYSESVLVRVRVVAVKHTVLKLCYETCELVFSGGFCEIPTPRNEYHCEVCDSRHWSLFRVWLFTWHSVPGCKDNHIKWQMMKFMLFFSFRFVAVAWTVTFLYAYFLSLYKLVLFFARSHFLRHFHQKKAPLWNRGDSLNQLSFVCVRL